MASGSGLPSRSRLALWRVEKLPIADIREQLEAASLPTSGTKRVLAKRLYDHLSSRASEPARETGSERETPHSSNASGEELERRGRSTERRRRRRRSRPVHRRRHSHSLRRSRSRSPLSSSSSHSSSSNSTTSPPSRSSSTGRSSQSRSASPRRRRRRRRPRSHGRSRTRSRTVSHKRRSHDRRRGRRSHSGSYRRGRSLGSLPPVPRSLKRGIHRGEFVELHKLLHANLTSACERGSRHKHSGRNAPGFSRPAAVITDLATWAEAWSTYAAVLVSFYPHLAPRLFLYQHFITLKSRSFQPSAWLRYDTEFRLKLAANNSWHFELVDTELWASCFSADGLSPAIPTPAPMACFTCGSLSHLYAACPQRTRRSNQPRQDTSRQDKPRTDTSTKPAAADQQEPCYIYNDKGRCFRGERCPYLHVCTYCGGQHSRRGCPDPRAR